MKRTVATIAACVLATATAIGATTTVTEAARSESFDLTSEFKFTVADSTVEPVMVLEHSLDGTTWSSTNEESTVHSLGLRFSPSAMALKVGEQNAVYAPMYVRLGSGTTSKAKATIQENQLTKSGFNDSLRSRVYFNTADCSATGVSGNGIQKSLIMRGQATDSFTVPAPTTDGQPGATVKLCIKAWMDNNNWLLGGKTPPTATANWRVTAQQ